MLPLLRRRAAASAGWAWANEARTAAAAPACTSPSAPAPHMAAEDLQGSSSCGVVGARTATASMSASTSKHTPAPSFCTRTFASAPQHEQQDKQTTQHAEEQGPHSASAAREGGASTRGRKDDEHIPLPAHDVYYAGPLSKTHKLLKQISLANTGLALAAAPAIVLYADASAATRVGLAVSLAMFGVMTTGALHWITRPYVHELKYSAAKQELDVKTTSLLSTPRWDRFSLSDVHPMPWNRPVATFMAKNAYYYIDVYNFPHEGLLQRLTPSDVPEGPGFREDED